MADHVEVLRLVDELFRKVLPKFNWSSDDFDAAGLTRDEVDLLNALPNLVQTRLRALSPAGGDWVAKEGDRALGKNRGYALAAPPQQEPGATERAFTEEVGKDDKPTGYLLFESAPSGQTLAGAGGDEVVARAFEERDHAKEQLRLLSEEMVYDGNSVSWIASKAKNYGNALLEAWDALKSVGVPCDGQTTVADAIRKHFATSAGTTGDDSEDAALPYLSEQMQGFLRVHPFGYSHALGLLNEYARAARRAREVGNG